MRRAELFENLIGGYWMEHKKVFVAVLLGILTSVLIYHGAYSELNSLPDEVRKPIDRTIETQITRNGGLTISRVGYLRNEFIASQGIGGAGGMGNNVIGITTKKDFLNRIKENNIKNVFYTFEKDYSLVKKYWAPCPNGIFELQIRHPYKNHYTIKDYSETEILYKKSSFSIILESFMKGIVAGAIVLLIVFAVLWILEKLYDFAEAIFMSYKYRSR